MNLLLPHERESAETKLRAAFPKLQRQHRYLLVLLLSELAPSVLAMRSALVEGGSMAAIGKLLDVRVCELRRALKGIAAITTLGGVTTFRGELRCTRAHPAVGYTLDEEGRKRLIALARGPFVGRGR